MFPNYVHSFYFEFRECFDHILVETSDEAHSLLRAGGRLLTEITL